MSAIDKRVTLLVDGITHCAGLSSGDGTAGMACGLIVFERTLDAIMKMFTEGSGKDVDCMACLVAEARNSRES